MKSHWVAPLDTSRKQPAFAAKTDSVEWSLYIVYGAGQGRWNSQWHRIMALDRLLSAVKPADRDPVDRPM